MPHPRGSERTARPIRSSETRGRERKILLTCLSTLADVVGYDGLRSLEPLSRIVEELPGEGELAKFLSLEECQMEVQRTLPREERKTYAAYYTTDRGIGILASEASKLGGSGLVVADPFMGSARLLTETVKSIGVDRVDLAWGIEPLPLPALVALASLVTVLGTSKVKVVVGDAFSLVPNLLSASDLPRADVIVTNPPFTRWKFLPKRYRARLLRVVEDLGYSRYLTRREMGLQVLSMFLVDHALKEGGFLGAVLPASTFYTIYGRGYKKLLLERYNLMAVVENSSSSFSVDSGFKELIILAAKGDRHHGETAIIRVNDSAEELGRVDIKELPAFLQMNWLSLFSPLRDLVRGLFERGLSKGTLGYWGDLGPDMVRGLEMYGPDFFFIPNRYWSVVEDGGDEVVISRGEDTLSLNRGFLVRCLRKPSLYARRIEVSPDSYMLSIPPLPLEELPPDVRRYVRWGERSKAAAPAVRAFGDRWYSHVFSQVESKRPFGRVFIPDKVDLAFRRRGVFANYSEEPVSASKNFYLIRGSGEEAKLIAAWLNSTPFLAVLHLMGRRISDTWTRLLENDYLELPMISPDPDVDWPVREAFDDVKARELPPLWEQLGEEYRERLDRSVIRAVGVDEGVLFRIYSTLRDLARSGGSSPLPVQRT